MITRPARPLPREGPTVAILPTDQTTVHYAPHGYAPVCGALARLVAAQDSGEVTIRYLQDSYKSTTNIYKVTCPLCVNEILRWANILKDRLNGR
jgi:hypothetical protein